MYDVYVCTHRVPDDNNIINLIDSTGWFYFFAFFKYIYIDFGYKEKKKPEKISIAAVLLFEYIYVRHTYTAHIKEVQFSRRLSCAPIVRYIVRAFVRAYTCISITYTVFTSGFYLRSRSLVYITVAVSYTYTRSEIVLEITATDTAVHDDYDLAK